MDDLEKAGVQLSLFGQERPLTVFSSTRTGKPISPEKMEKREREKKSLQFKLSIGDSTHLITRVAHILNRYPDARNSDITLQLRYWETYQPDLYNKGTVDMVTLYQFEKLTSLARARAKIQNEYGLFTADPNVRRYRKTLEAFEREYQLSKKPDTPTLTINCDESGKSGKGRYLIVGSVWLLDKTREVEIKDFFTKWKLQRSIKITDEFHFTEMRKHELAKYKDFFREIIKVSDMMSFKAIIIDKNNLDRSRDTDEVISELHYQLVHFGIQQEVQNNRVSLPRYVDFWKDSEKGVDALTLTKIEQKLQMQFKVNYEGKLRLSLFDAVESHWSIFVQIADLFTGCLNRVLNEQEGSNHKDEFARFVLPLLGLDPRNVLNSSNELARVFELR